MRARGWMTFICLACAAPSVILACSSDDNTATPSTSPSSTTSSTGTTSATGSSTSTPGTDSGADAGTLYDRLGGKDGINSALDAIVAAELADTEIASYFFNQVKTPVPEGHPDAAAIKECFEALLGAKAGGPETYPIKTSGGFQCRTMIEAHAALGIPHGTFEKFITIAAGVLKSAGVADADIATIGSVLEGTSSAIVTDTARDGGPFEGDAN